jgi:Adenylosuccinate synthetase
MVSLMGHIRNHIRHHIRHVVPTRPSTRGRTYEQLAERSGIPIGELKETETTTTTKRQRRLAEFDWAQFQRSVFSNGPTDIALTFVDYLDIKNREAYRFEQLTPETLRFRAEHDMRRCSQAACQRGFSFRGLSCHRLFPPTRAAVPWARSGHQRPLRVTARLAP